MKTKLLFATIAIITFSTFVCAQKFSQDVKSSATFAEIILRQADLESDLGELLVNYTNEHPKVQETQYELKILKNDLSYIAKFKGTQTNFLTEALGKLLVRRAQISTDYWVMQNRFSDEHPNTKKAKRKLVVFNNAIKKILE